QVTGGEFTVTISHTTVSTTTPLTQFTVEGTTESTSDTSKPKESNDPLVKLLTTRCTYDVTIPAKESQLPWVVVSPLGQVLSSNLAEIQFDEDDTLIVYLVADPDLIGQLVVRRKSTFREPGQIRILGSEVTRDQVNLQAGRVATCPPHRFELRDFAPGRGEVEIAALVEVGKPTAVGSFEFAVNPLYTGMLSFGPTWSKNVDPDFDLAMDANQQVIVQNNQGGRDLKYAVYYTPFIWGKRDPEKSHEWYGLHGSTNFKKKWYPWLQHVNPSLGFTLENLSDNALVGVSVDFGPAFVVTVGDHFRKVEVLQDLKGVRLGKPFAGKREDLPIGRSWEDESFIAVSIDLRAAVKALKSVVKSKD
ncbi:MAG TPA: hypothetical protein VE222_02085, partial [Nitrospiraceae bacterium]|nr:hypothetical protein [Nitrospiraceae bacterium]